MISYRVKQLRRRLILFTNTVHSAAAWMHSALVTVANSLLRAARYLTNRPERFFLAFFLPIAVVLCILLPPFMGPDEASHTYRAYEFSRGDLILNKYPGGYGYTIPTSLVNLNSDQYWSNSNKSFRTALNHNLHGYGRVSGPTTIQYFEGTVSYTPLAYVQYIAAFLIAHALALNAYFTFILLRLSGIIAFAALAYFGIRLAPRRKWFLVLIALLPMTIHQAVVVSTDGITNGGLLLSVGILANLYSSKKSTDKRNTHFRLKLAVLLLSLFVVALSKQAYILIPLLLLFLPRNIFSHSNQWKRYVYGGLASIFIIFIAWTLFTASISTRAFTTWQTREGWEAPLTTRQWISGDVLHPLHGLRVLANTYVYSIDTNAYTPGKNYTEYDDNSSPDFLYNSFFGSFGSLNTIYPEWVTILILTTLVAAFLKEESILATRRQRNFLLLLILAQVALLTLVFWLKWSSPIFAYVQGIQGRYLIPLVGICALLPAVKFIKFTPKDRSLHLFFSAAITVEAMLMLLLIHGRFYK